MLLKKQDILIKDINRDNIFILDQVQTTACQNGGEYAKIGDSNKHHYRASTFMFINFSSHQHDGSMGYTLQGDYIKFHFRLKGSNIFIFDGFGQYVVEQPQLLITSGPEEMIKAEVAAANSTHLSVNLCVLREFFPHYLGLEPEALPEPLHTIVQPEKTQFAAYSMLITPEMDMAVRSTLAGANTGPMMHLFYESKAVELMCLLITQLQRGHGAPSLTITAAAKKLR